MSKDIKVHSLVISQVFNGRPPFTSLRPAHAITKISRGERPFHNESQRPIPSELWDLMQKCWQHDHRSRPAAAEVATACEKILNTPNTPSSSHDAQDAPSPRRHSTSAKNRPNSNRGHTPLVGAVEGQRRPSRSENLTTDMRHRTSGEDDKSQKGSGNRCDAPSVQILIKLNK